MNSVVKQVVEILEGHVDPGEAKAEIIKKLGDLPETWHITKAQIAEFQQKGAAPSEYVAAAIGSIMPESMDSKGVGGFTSVDVTIAFVNSYPVAAAEMLRHLMDQGVAASRPPPRDKTDGEKMGGS